MVIYAARIRWRDLSAVLTLAAAFALCLLGGQAESPTVSAALLARTEADQTAYLEQLGWQVSDEPLETLELQLPDDLKADYADYCKLQEEQGMPFSEFAGQTVKRCTYTVTNYPNIERGVQANLYLCGDQIIAGDIIATGENGFQSGLAFPES